LCDTISRPGQDSEHPGDRRHAARKGHGNVALLRIGEVLFQHILVRFAEAIINVDRGAGFHRHFGGLVGEFGEPLGTTLGTIEPKRRRRRDGRKEMMTVIPARVIHLAVDQVGFSRIPVVLPILARILPVLHRIPPFIFACE
jgi:hypothetical protein